MSYLVTAAKTPKALGDDDDGLKCVESDPPEIQRSALKKIRRAAGPATKYQELLRDCVHLSRLNERAAHYVDLNLRRGAPLGGWSVGAVVSAWVSTDRVQQAA